MGYDGKNVKIYGYPYLVATMSKLSKGLLTGVLILGVLLTAREVWKAVAPPPEAIETEKATQRMIKFRCNLYPDNPECKDKK